MQKILSFLLLFISAAALGQSFGQQKISADLDLNRAGTKYNDSAAHITAIDLRLSFPIVAVKKSRISGSVIYNHLEFNDFPSAFATSLNGLAFGLNWTRVLSSRHMLVLSGDVGFYSDFKTISSDAIREGFSATYFTRYSKTFMLGLGIAYKYQFYGNQIIPVIVILYTGVDNSHWKLSGALPYNPKLTYKVDHNNGISLEMKQTFSSYLLSAARDSGSFIRNQRLSFMLNYEYSFAEGWRIHAGLGFSPKQKYELYNKQDAGKWYIINSALGYKPVPVESVSNRGLLFNIGITFNPKF